MGRQRLFVYGGLHYHRLEVIYSISPFVLRLDDATIGQKYLPTNPDDRWEDDPKSKVDTKCWNRGWVIQVNILNPYLARLFSHFDNGE